jgi:hypothetical protein
MPKSYIVNNGNLIVTFTLQDILYLAVYVPKTGEKPWSYVGSLEDILKFLAWRMVGNKRPDLVKQTYAYGYVEIEGETIKVVFTKEDVPQAPPNP